MVRVTVSTKEMLVFTMLGLLRCLEMIVDVLSFGGLFRLDIFIRCVTFLINPYCWIIGVKILVLGLL